ncbi:MAG: hypothetical protein K6E19_09895, partial [Lachnospiraceae bacterium]|nr:hypothetical protein [Lachnospiraceae bacterium]
MAGLPINFLSGLINRQPADNSINSLYSQSGVAADANTKALMSLLDSLSNGETIVGKVMSQKDGLLQIMTGDNVMINAEVADGVTLAEGSTALFEVNKSSDNHVSLRPLYHNMASEATALSAIKQAGLPVNDRTMEMVARNMEYGNPVDRNSLVKAYRDVAMFPDVPVKYITDLQKMGIPASNANYEQYEAYLNMENSVSEAFSKIGDSIINEINNELESVITQETVNGQTLVNADMSEKLPISNSLDEGVATQTLQQTGTDLLSPKGSLGIVDSLVDFADSFKETPASDISFSKEEVIKLASEFKGFDGGKGLIELAEGEAMEYDPVTVFKTAVKDLREGVVSLNRETVSALTEQAELTDNAHAIKLPAGFKELLNRTLSSQWALDDEQISDKREVRDLYDRLFSQSTKLLTALTDNVGKDSPVTQTVRNLSDNLQFMNSLNNFVPYVQIPFRGQSGNTGSELYVYKNKRSLADGDSEVSAFIHLDMESLGPTDVYVRLKDN